MRTGGVVGMSHGRDEWMHDLVPQVGDIYKRTGGVVGMGHGRDEWMHDLLPQLGMLKTLCIKISTTPFNRLGKILRHRLASNFR